MHKLIQENDQIVSSVELFEQELCLNLNLMPYF